jgi:hypothetical protein
MMISIEEYIHYDTLAEIIKSSSLKNYSKSSILGNLWIFYFEQNQCCIRFSSTRIEFYFSTSDEHCRVAFSSIFLRLKQYIENIEELRIPILLNVIEIVQGSGIIGDLKKHEKLIKQLELNLIQPKINACLDQFLNENKPQCDPYPLHFFWEENIHLYNLMMDKNMVEPILKNGKMVMANCYFNKNKLIELSKELTDYGLYFSIN